MRLFRVKIIVVASSVAALGLLKKEESLKKKKKKEENPIFDLCWLAALERLASMFYPFLIINLFGKRCHACLKLNSTLTYK